MKLEGKNITRKIIIILVLILLMGCSVSFGVSYSKQITAWFYNIQVKLNGDTLNFSKQPFIYEGSVYISLRDVSQSLGIDVKWDGNTRTVYLTDNNISNNIPNNIPNYYPDNSQYVFTHSIDAIEDRLNNEYEEYTDGDEDLEFEYEIIERSGSIRVKMEGSNFKGDSSDWEKRDDRDFKDFIEDIAKLVADELDDDVEVYVYDRNSKNIGKYEYDEGRNEFETEYEYGEEKDDDDVEDELDEDYETYEDGDEDLEFEYRVSEYSRSVGVRMKGKNFERDSSEWEDRDESDFRDFVEEIAQKVGGYLEKDVTIEVYDEDNEKAGEYKYDESRDDFNVEYEYDKDNNIDFLQEKLNDDYDKYTEGDEQLEFTYELDERSDYTRVVMDGENFTRDSSKWENRNDSKFQDFIESVAEEVEDIFTDLDVKIYVYDEDGDSAGRYIYDESDDDLTVDSQYGDD